MTAFCDFWNDKDCESTQSTVGYLFLYIYNHFLKIYINFYIFIKTICQIPELTCEGDVVHKNSLKEGLKMNEPFRLEDSQILRSFDNLGPEMDFTLKIRVSEHTLRQARNRFKMVEVLQTLMFCRKQDLHLNLFETTRE